MKIEVPFQGAVFLPQHTSKFVCVRLNENVLFSEDFLEFVGQLFAAQVAGYDASLTVDEDG